MSDDQEVLCNNCGATDPERFLTDAVDADAEEVEREVAETDSFGCSECYQNDGCPDECNEPHETPEQDSEWECPTNGSRWRWCDVCVEWSPMHRYDRPSTDINGTLYCDPYEHDMGTCASCGEWSDYDSLMYSEYSDESYCRYCYDEHGGGHVEADWHTRGHCSTCGTSLRGAVVFDTETERAYCGSHDHDGPEFVTLEAA